MKDISAREDVLETIRDSERAEAAYDRRMYRYKAHYSLDCDNGIENAILMKPQTPEAGKEQVKKKAKESIMDMLAKAKINADRDNRERWEREGRIAPTKKQDMEL